MQPVQLLPLHALFAPKPLTEGILSCPLDTLAPPAVVDAALIPNPRQLQALQGGMGDAPTLPRPLTDDEKTRLKGYFPILDTDKAVVTGETSDAYNCISWTVGETQQWFWPPDMFPEETEESAFNKFYASYGLVPTASGAQGPVAVWRNDEGFMHGYTHGCIQGPGHGPRWESKCGSDLRIQHDLNELTGDEYGHVAGFYKAQGGAPPKVSPYAIITLPDEVKDTVRQRAAAVDPALMARFDAQYVKWQAFRAQAKVHASANPAVYCQTPAFDAITALGPAALPLLMDKMAAGDFFCLQAVNAIVRAHPDDPALSRLAWPGNNQNNSEQNKAAQAVLNWV